ncbi:cyclic nucleotide-binding domain-containing protein [Rhodospirillum sp. A1_3_36]|uniref:cyclic nucleotide-binding domain-containing protein n=1 Tax=Rhodospirillum sp. A1_3_36 TaxID=3391666 RepID=UPI0039A659D0
MTLSKDKPLERRVYARGKTVFRQGEEGDAAYIIETGLVGVYRRNEAGQETHLGTLTPGCLFGEMAVIDGGRRMASAVVEEGAVLLRIPADQMRAKLVGADPFLKAVLKMMLNNLRTVHGLYQNIPGNFPEHVGLMKQTAESLERYCSEYKLQQTSPEVARYLGLMFQALDGLGVLADSGVGITKRDAIGG